MMRCQVRLLGACLLARMSLGSFSGEAAEATMPPAESVPRNDTMQNGRHEEFKDDHAMPGRSPVETEAEKVKARYCLDNDVCLQMSWFWSDWRTCAESTEYCESWSQDMHRCCPNACRRGYNLKDEDTCLQDTVFWGDTYTCAGSTEYCESWPKDMHRCCPNACKATPVCDVWSCNILSGFGTCTPLSFTAVDEEAERKLEIDEVQKWMQPNLRIALGRPFTYMPNGSMAVFLLVVFFGFAGLGVCTAHRHRWRSGSETFVRLIPADED